MKKKELKRQLRLREERIVDLKNFAEDQAAAITKLYGEKNDLLAEIEELNEKIEALEDAYRSMYLIAESLKEHIKFSRRLEPKQIIQSAKEGTTIILWEDNTKTVVKCGKGDKYNPLTGIAVAYLKKMLSPGTYQKVIVAGKCNIVDRDKISAERKKKGKKGK